MELEVFCFMLLWTFTTTFICTEVTLQVMSLHTKHSESGDST